MAEKSSSTSFWVLQAPKSWLKYTTNVWCNIPFSREIFSFGEFFKGKRLFQKLWPLEGRIRRSRQIFLIHIWQWCIKTLLDASNFEAEARTFFDGISFVEAS